MQNAPIYHGLQRDLLRGERCALAEQALLSTVLGDVGVEEVGVVCLSLTS